MCTVCGGRLLVPALGCLSQHARACFLGRATMHDYLYGDPPSRPGSDWASDTPPGSVMEDDEGEGDDEGRGTLLTCGDVEQNPGPSEEVGPPLLLGLRMGQPHPVLPPLDNAGDAAMLESQVHQAS